MSDGQQFEMFTADGQVRKRQGKKPGPKPKLKAQQPDTKPQKPKSSAKLVTVTLQLRHSVNGISYGPGDVTVSENLAAMFLHTEANTADKELSLVQQRAYIISFTRHGPVKRQVPWAQFDRILGQMEVPLESMTQGG